MSRLLQPRLRPSRRTWIAIGLAVALMVVVFVEVTRQYQRLGRSVIEKENILAIKSKAIIPTPSIVELDNQKRWSALKTEREFAWGPTFDAIEKTATKDIELLEFQPERSSRSIILRGEAKDRKSLIVFIEALASQKTLTNVHLVHQQIMLRDRLETITFEIKASTN